VQIISGIPSDVSGFEADAVDPTSILVDEMVNGAGGKHAERRGTIWSAGGE